MNKYRAKKSLCSLGHTHASKREAARCDYLSMMERSGQISGLQQQPVFRFHVDGRPVKMGNGQQAKITADFSYVENQRLVVEDSKGFVVRDFPLRWALAKTLWPDIEWRVV